MRTPERDTIRIEDRTLRQGFTRIPNGVLRREGLSPGAKLAYMGLLSYAWQEDSCFPGQARLAADLGVGQRSVIRYLKELQRAKLLTIKRRGLGKTNIYILPKDDEDQPSQRNGEAGKLPAHRRRSRSARLADQEVPEGDHPEVPNWQREEDTEEKDTDRHHSKLRTINQSKIQEEQRERQAAPDTSTAGSGSKQLEAVGDYLKTRAPAPAAGRNEPSASDREILMAFWEPMAAEMRDMAPASTVTELLRYFEQSKLERIPDMLPVLYEARAITKERTGNIRSGEPGARNLVPYFKEVVKDKLGLKPEQSRRSQTSPPPE